MIIIIKTLFYTCIGICNGCLQYLSPEWDSVTDQAKRLIDSMLTMDSDKRITAEEALNTPWIKVTVTIKIKLKN